MRGATLRLSILFLLLFSFMATNICTGDTAVVVVEDSHHHDEADAFAAGFIAGCISALLLSRIEEETPRTPRPTRAVATNTHIRR